MPISFTCPHCGFQKTVGDQFAGQSGKCAQCGQPVAIPAIAPGTGPPLYASATPPAKNSSSATVIIVVIVAVMLICPCLVGIPVALLLPAIQSARQAATRMQSSNNMKMIAISLLNYEDSHKVFPAASLADESTGKPPHSWRVALLEFVDPDLFKEYDFSKPWDDPVNLRLESRMPEIYKNHRFDAEPYHTNYLAVVGDRTVLQVNRFVKLSDVIDGSSRTIVIVEAVKTVHWMEPTDLDFSQMDFELNASDESPGLPDGIGEDSPEYTPQAIFLDGSVRRLDEDMGLLDPDELESAFVIDDDE